MYKILTLNNISQRGLDRFPKKVFEISNELTDPDAILLRSFKMHDYPVPTSLKAVGRAGAGVNNIPVDEFTKKGIPVFNTPGANANAVAEIVLTAMLMASRNVAQAWEFARNLEGTDAEISKQVESGKKNFVGMELPGKTLSVIGLGAIGVKVANNAMALGMNVIGYDPLLTVDRALELNSNVNKTSSIDEALFSADYITFHVPLTDDTKNLLNDTRVKRLKENVIVLNFAREGIVNEDAIATGIESGRVYSYICDFPTNKLKN
ncbi:MAG: 3-phosphoglycerate dehydrogenase, partial [Leptospiraceae bacterium]|nr:3-phosphoglycerate dehydrogenase [Leptospiraceae bacterium]